MPGIELFLLAGLSKFLEYSERDSKAGAFCDSDGICVRVSKDAAMLKHGQSCQILPSPRQMVVTRWDSFTCYKAGELQTLEFASLNQGSNLSTAF